MDEEAPFLVTTTNIKCPFFDDWELPIKIGWVNPDYPVLYLEAPELIEHLREFHRRT